MNKILRSLLITAATLMATSAVQAIVDSGNTLALDVATAKKPEQKKKFIDGAVGEEYYFRYLKVLEMNDMMTNGYRIINMKTVEPSSDMMVEFTVQKKVSLDIIDREPKTKVGDAVGILGRVESINKTSTNSIVIRPVIVKHKDNLAPKRGKELLYEIDPNAQIGQDWSTGKRVDIKGPKK